MASGRSLSVRIALTILTRRARCVSTGFSDLVDDRGQDKQQAGNTMSVNGIKKRTVLFILTVMMLPAVCGAAAFAGQTEAGGTPGLSSEGPKEETASAAGDTKETEAESGSVKSIYINADEDSEGLITMGFIVIDNYNYIDVNGEWRGYDIELMLKMAEYGNLQIQGVPFYSSAEALDALRDGSVDALIDFNKTKERSAEFLLSSNTVASDNLVVYARADDDRFTYGSMTQLDGILIGTIEGSGVNELLPEECKKYKAAPTLVPYETVEAINEALDGGEIDAACSGSNAAPREYKAIASFRSDSAYILLKKGEDELRAVLDNAMSTLKAEEPFYIYNLSSKYITQSASGMVELTEEEQAFIASSGGIAVAFQKNAAPYSEEKAGKMTGILPEYYEVLSEKTGLTFTFKGYDSYQDAVGAVLSGEADVLGVYYGDIITANYEGLHITSAYTPFDCIRMSRNEADATIESVAVTVRMQEILRVQLAQQGYTGEVVPYANMNACYEAFKKGEVDAIVCSMTSASWLLNQHTKARITLTSMPEIQLDIAACTAHPGMLYSILNKAIASSETDMQSLIARYSVMDQSSLKSLIENLPTTVILAVTGTIMAILIALIVALVTLYRRDKEKADLQQRETLVSAEREFNEKRSAFFSNISHDMRTPLNAIIGFSELAKNSTDKKQTDEYLTKIQTSGGVLMNLINDTLTVSRMNNGKLELKLGEAHTAKLFDEILVPVRAAAEKKGITFSQSLPSEDRVIICDSLNLEKIIMNILSNAVKYTPQGGSVDLKAEFTPAAADGEQTIPGTESASGRGEITDDVNGADAGKRVHLRVVVKDTGVGMDEKFLPKIFDAFSQENNKFGVTSGVGLGLAIVKELTDLMGGEISVESKKGQGTQFTVGIDFDEVSSGPDSSGTGEVSGVKRAGAESGGQSKNTAAGMQSTAVPGSGQSAAGSGAENAGRDVDLTGKNILLCEDNDLNAEIACAILNGCGAQVTVAENGEVGVERFLESSTNYYALVLMDIRMPVMDGYEATRQIRETERSDAKSVPIVAMSADAFEDDIQKCMDAGMDGHIPKPIDMDKLFRVLREIE